MSYHARIECRNVGSFQTTRARLRAVSETNKSGAMRQGGFLPEE